ncbi:MAG: 4Fe-4S dicluster domain-containing protein [Candidatus Woesearchaeota archaeon]
MNTLINKDDVPKFLSALMQRFEVIAPKKSKGMLLFEPIADFKEIDFSQQTSYSAKKYFLPAKESIFSYKGTKIEVKLDSRPRIIIMHPCDANAVLNLDRIFLDENLDPYYKARRDATLLFVFSCSQSYKNCFCTSVNSCETVNYDLLFVDIGDKYVVSVGTSRAKELLSTKLFTNIIREGACEVKCKKKLNSTNQLGSFFLSKVWKSESKKCLFCNACIIACPSCFCFTMHDEPNLDLVSGERKRQWDYCYMHDHTKVAGGFVFRKERSKRFKHRIYHQLKYFKDKFGRQLCVGCGRCIDVCPAKIDMVEIVNSLK